MTSNICHDASKDVCDADASSSLIIDTIDMMQEVDQFASSDDEPIHGSSRINDEQEEHSSTFPVVEQMLAPGRFIREARVPTTESSRNKDEGKQARSSDEYDSGLVEKHRRRESEWPNDAKGSISGRSRTSPLRGLSMPGEGEGPSLPSSFQMPPVSRPSSVKRGSLLDILNGVASASSSVFPAEPSGMISGSGTQDEAPPLFPLVFPVSSERPRSRVANGGKHAAHRRRTASEASPPPGYACRLCNEQWTCVPRLTSMIGPPPVPDIKVPASPPIAIEPQVALSNARSQISRARPTEEQLLALGVPCDLVNPYRCCEQVFVNFYDATSHVAGHSEAACAKDKPYSCIYPSCEYRSFQPVHIAQHFLSDVHFGAKVACPGCGLQFARPATMLHHLSQIKKRDGSLEQHFAH